jgi:hypothetical protein
MKPARVRASPALPHRQRGAATLVVVMVLFFIVSLVAAYTSRNLIFEQRISSNQWRATTAFEAAQAGVDWAVAMLNSGRIDANCLPLGAGAAAPTVLLSDGPQVNGDVTNSFRDRYLSIDFATGIVSPRVWNTGALGFLSHAPACIRQGDGWACSCPSGAAAALPAAAALGVSPGFRLRFEPVGGAAGMVRIVAIGCTLVDAPCLDTSVIDYVPQPGESGAWVERVVALRSPMIAPPSAALTIGGTLNVGGAAMTIANPDPAGSGLTVLAGGAVANAGLVLQGAAGTPGANTVIDNDAAIPANANRRFERFLGLERNMFTTQPAAIVPACGGGANCTAAEVRAVADLHPWRVIVVPGTLDIDSAGDIGSAATPVTLLVGGDVTWSAAGSTIHGVVYTQAAAWNTAGSGLVRGAVIAEGDVAGNGTPQFLHERSVLTLLRFGSGSFVPVPGSWRDFSTQ